VVTEIIRNNSSIQSTKDVATADINIQSQTKNKAGKINSLIQFGKTISGRISKTWNGLRSTSFFNSATVENQRIKIELDAVKTAVPRLQQAEAARIDGMRYDLNYDAGYRSFRILETNGEPTTQTPPNLAYKLQECLQDNIQKHDLNAQVSIWSLHQENQCTGYSIKMDYTKDVRFSYDKLDALKKSVNNDIKSIISSYYPNNPAPNFSHGLGSNQLSWSLPLYPYVPGGTRPDDTQSIMDDFFNKI